MTYLDPKPVDPKEWLLVGFSADGWEGLTLPETIRVGTRFLLFGKNNSGKSSFVRLLLTLCKLTPDIGWQVFYEDLRPVKLLDDADRHTSVDRVSRREIAALRGCLKSTTQALRVWTSTEEKGFTIILHLSSKQQGLATCGVNFHRRKAGGFEVASIISDPPCISIPLNSRLVVSQTEPRISLPDSSSGLELTRQWICKLVGRQNTSRYKRLDLRKLLVSRLSLNRSGVRSKWLSRKSKSKSKKLLPAPPTDFDDLELEDLAYSLAANSSGRIRIKEEKDQSYTEASSKGKGLVWFAGWLIGALNEGIEYFEHPENFCHPMMAANLAQRLMQCTAFSVFETHSEAILLRIQWLVSQDELPLPPDNVVLLVFENLRVSRNYVRPNGDLFLPFPNGFAEIYWHARVPR